MPIGLQLRPEVPVIYSSRLGAMRCFALRCNAVRCLALRCDGSINLRRLRHEYQNQG